MAKLFDFIDAPNKAEESSEDSVLGKDEKKD